MSPSPFAFHGLLEGFEPVPFGPLSDELGDEGRRKLTELFRRLSEQEGLLSLVCGFATEGEMQPLSEEAGRYASGT